MSQFVWWTKVIRVLIIYPSEIMSCSLDPSANNVQVAEVDAKESCMKGIFAGSRSVDRVLIPLEASLDEDRKSGPWEKHAREVPNLIFTSLLLVEWIWGYVAAGTHRHSV